MREPNLVKPIVLSLAAAMVVIAMKSAAYFVTGSVGLFSDALENTLNLLTAATAYFSLYYAARPVDSNHMYGHEKIEFFSTGLEGILITCAGLGTIWLAVRHWIDAHELTKIDLGVGLTVIASAINFAVARTLLKLGRIHDSPVLHAEGRHLMTDVWSSAAVIAGLVLVELTGNPIFDALTAFAVGILITWTGYQLVRKSFDGLMDHALSVAEQDEIRAAIRTALPPGADFHHVRSRRAGRRKFFDFHMLFPGDTSVREAHRLAHCVEDYLLEKFPGLEVSIHMEPIDDPSSWEHAQLARLGEPPEPRASGAMLEPP